MKSKSIFLSILFIATVFHTKHVKAVEWKEALIQALYGSVELIKEHKSAITVVATVGPTVVAAGVKVYLWLKTARMHEDIKANGQEIKELRNQTKALCEQVDGLETQESAAQREDRLKALVSDTSKHAHAERIELKELLDQHGEQLGQATISLKEMKAILAMLQGKNTVSPEDLQRCLGLLKQELESGMQEMEARITLTILAALRAQTNTIESCLTSSDDRHVEGSGNTSASSDGGGWTIGFQRLLSSFVSERSSSGGQVFDHLDPGKSITI